jgi:hypothetical protein
MTKIKALIVFGISMGLGASLTMACSEISDMTEKNLESPIVAAAPSGSDVAPGSDTAGTVTSPATPKDQ